MKGKTSVTLSEDILKSRDRRDIELINRHADELNEEAEDVLAYQVET